MEGQYNAYFMEIYRQYCDMVYRIGFSFMKSTADAEDVVSEIFLKLLQAEKMFDTKEHAKAWLIVATSNYCKDQLKRHWRKNKSMDCENIGEIAGKDKVEINETLEAVLQLPEKYKLVIYLYFYEGYNSIEIGAILKKSASAVRNDLQKAKKMLKTELE